MGARKWDLGIEAAERRKQPWSRRYCRIFEARLIIGGMKSLSFVGLIFLLALRSACCGETNHDFGKWEKEISAYQASDKTNPPPKRAFLFIGSSTVRLWKTLPQD